MSTKRLMLIGVVLAALVVGSGIAGGLYRSKIVVNRVEVRHAMVADSMAIVERAGVRPGDRLYETRSSVLADRVRRHPWVQSATIRRRPSGALVIAVAERQPMLAVVGPEGEIAYLVDAGGYKLPTASGVVLDLPMLHGYPEAYVEGERIDDVRITRLAKALAADTKRSRRLVSQIIVREGELALVTRESGGTSYAVRLGDTDYGEQLDRLDAYWQQVLPKSDASISVIDLRFHGRVITS